MPVCASPLVEHRLQVVHDRPLDMFVNNTAHSPPPSFRIYLIANLFVIILRCNSQSGGAFGCGALGV